MSGHACIHQLLGQGSVLGEVAINADSGVIFWGVGEYGMLIKSHVRELGERERMVGLWRTGRLQWHALSERIGIPSDSTRTEMTDDCDGKLRLNPLHITSTQH